MIVLKSLKDFREWRCRVSRKGGWIGFVPTMGYLHEGHLSLIRAARHDCKKVVVSIFVNPTQFGPGEDFQRYPRDIRRDLALCRRGGVDVVLQPTVRAIYPSGFQTFVEVGRLAECLCGPRRPGHFRGVATVVTKLFHWVEPQVAYLGQKDYQQALIIRQLVRDLDWDIKIRICPTVRERDGLAMSSRNAYLNVKERQRARSLFESMRMARYEIEKGVRDPKKICSLIRRYLSHYVSRVDYVEMRAAEDLSPIRRVRGKIVVALACFVGKTRLIDNMILKVS